MKEDLQHQELSSAPHADVSSQPPATDSSRALITALSHFIAHDLANPLSGLELTLYLLQRQKLPEKSQDMVERCLSQTRQLLRTVDALGALGGAEDPRLDQVSMREIAEESIAKLKLESRFEVISKLGEESDPLLVRGNRPLLALALQQLLRNAAEASRAGDKIGIEGHSSGDRLEIVIWDHGPGVLEEHLPHLFKIPFSTKERAGVGLLIANAAVCGPNRGGLRYEQHPSGGARFSILLPLAT